jgi:hypothetical protein
MGCTCARPSDEMLFREFFSKLKLREFDTTDFVTTVKMKLGKSRKITKVKWEKLKENIVAKEDEEFQGQLFDKIQSKIEEDELGSALLILSLLFFCKNKPEQFATAFVSCVKIMNYEFSLLVNNDSEHVKRDFLKKIVEFYVSLVSIEAVKPVSCFVNNREEFEKHYSKVYSDTVIQEAVEFILKDFKEESVDLNDFVKMKYPILIDDGLVRSYLNNIYIRTI